MKFDIDKFVYSTEILRRLNESSKIALSLSDKSGNIIDCSPGFELALGYSLGELQLRGWKKLTCADDLPLDEAFINKCVTGEISEYTIQKRYVHKQGFLVPAKVTVILVNGGVVPHGLFVAHHIFPSTCDAPCKLEEAQVIEVVPKPHEQS